LQKEIYMGYQHKFLRHFYIIEQLSIKPQNWESIHRRLLNKLSDQLGDYSIRTFQRDIKAIDNIFGIEIKYSTTLLAYHVSSKNDLKMKLNAWSQLNMNMESSEVQRKIIQDKIEGLGSMFLSDINEAMEGNFFLEFEYHKYYDLSSKKRRVIPLVLKEVNKRWYLLAEDLDKGALRIFALDRVLDLNIHYKTIKGKFDSNTYQSIWENTMGIEIGGFGQSVEKIIIKVDEKMAPYFKSLPWHQTQKIVKEDSTGILLEMELMVTNDLINKIMSIVQHTEIIEPNHLKEKIKLNLIKALRTYEKEL